eukprot:5067858-Amphidinium_carterae.1
MQEGSDNGRVLDLRSRNKSSTDCFEVSMRCGRLAYNCLLQDGMQDAVAQANTEGDIEGSSCASDLVTTGCAAQSEKG